MLPDIKVVKGDFDCLIGVADEAKTNTPRRQRIIKDGGNFLAVHIDRKLRANRQDGQAVHTPRVEGKPASCRTFCQGLPFSLMIYIDFIGVIKVEDHAVMIRFVIGFLVA